MLQFILGFRTFMNIKRGNGYNVEYNSDRRIWRGRKMKEKSKDLVEISNMNELRKKDSYTLQKEAIQLNRASNLSITELGKRLIILKEQCLKHSEYVKFIEEKLHLKYSIANKYVRITRAYGLTEDNKNMELVTDLGIKKAIRLLKITDLQERLQFIKDNDLVNKSYQEIDKLLTELYPSDVKALNGYSLYTNIHRSLKLNLETLTGNKDILKDKDTRAEAQEIEKELEMLISRIENLKSRLGKTEETKTEQAN